MYFIKGSLYETLIGLFGKKNIASAKFNKHIYIGKPDFEKNILGVKNNDLEWVNLVQIITHEGVHSQMYRDYSRFGIMKTPSWINEGYAEYISYRMARKQPDYELSMLLEKHEKTEAYWVRTEYKSMTPKQYIRDRILLEYLIDNKQMSIEEIIDGESIEPEEIMKEIKEIFREK